MQDVLPPGVGRVPQWWMEITPHYVLDLEEEEYRRRAEEQMAYYYAELAAASDAGRVDADGNPILMGPDGKPIAWGGIKNGWAGRSSTGGSGGAGGQDGPLGRHFVPGQVTPETLKLLGISADNDPDYKSYLSGAKYPPGYWEKLAELGYSTGPGFSANNLAQTDFGRYGRQAEQPKHKPTWAKMKLRSTSHGQDIRQGVYDSPKRETSRRVVTEGTDGPTPKALLMMAPTLDDDNNAPGPPARAPARPTPPPPPRAVTPAAAAPTAPTPPVRAAAPAASASGGGAPPSPGKKKVIRKVRKVRRKREEGEEAPIQVPSTNKAPAPITLHVPQMPQPKPVVVQVNTPEEEPVPQVRRYNHKDYYYNAPASNAYAGTSRSNAAAAAAAPSAGVNQAPTPKPQAWAQAATPKAALPPPPPADVTKIAVANTAPAADRPTSITIPSGPVAPPSPYVEDLTGGYEDEEEEEEEIIEEEIIDDEEEYEEEYEEVLEDEEEYEEEDDLDDLQAILAAKQAELARLQAQLSAA